MKVMTAKEWYESNKSNGGTLVDVRTPFEFASERAEGALNLPLDQFSVESLKALLKSERQGESCVPVGLICQSGSRAKQAVERCETTDDLEVALIEGGTQAWVAAGLPKVTGKKVMSLERQVRIAAGCLVLAGVVLSKMVLPGAEYLSAFVGAGLIFAGITDTCGMGMMIAKMPWNQVSSCESSGCGMK
jgi:rhodanese-related sulfurtransferase